VTINCVAEHPWWIGKYVSEQLSWHSQWWTRVVLIVETKFSALLHFSYPDDSSCGESSAYITSWTNSGGQNAQSGRDIQECHRQDDLWDGFQASDFVWCGNANLTNEKLNTTIDKPNNRWNIHLVSYDTLTSRATPSHNAQLSYCSWCFGSFDESHRYWMKYSVGWQITFQEITGFNHQVAAMLRFHSLHEWCYQTMCLFPGVPEDLENITVMETHREEAIYSTVKSSMHAIQTEDKNCKMMQHTGR